MSDNVAQLVPTKSDKELAEELKQELIISCETYLKVCTKANRLGFIVNAQFGPNAFGEFVINQLVLSKQY